MGNRNAMKHGGYSSRLSPEEQSLRDEILRVYQREVPNPSVFDRFALELVAYFETKLRTILVYPGIEGAEAANKMSRALHRELKALKLTRESRGGADSKGGNSDAEVIARMLGRFEAAKKR